MMKKLLKIPLYIFSLIIWINWWIMAIIVIDLMIIISLIIPKNGHNILVRIICKILLFYTLLFPRYKGLKPKDIPFPVIYVANHVSFFDLFISGAVLPGHPRGLELESHFKTPIYGWGIKRFGQIPINPGNKSSVRNSLAKAGLILKKKVRSLLVMPEGHRTRNGEIGFFRTGAFYLSRKYNIPIVPVVYKDLFKRKNCNSIIIHPGFFDVIIMPPVYPDKFNDDDTMAQYIKGIMAKKLTE
jgi:1-acyl-sn-glycerol-3-phosphate acyltransferase